MRRLSSTAVVIGLTTALAAACSEEPESRTDWHRICVDQNGVRVEDAKCPDDDRPSRFFYPYWIYSNHTAPAVGHKVTTGSGVTTKPTTGIIGRPPATGGFGTYRAGTGGGSSGG